jgi:hypothetical protein
MLHTADSARKVNSNPWRYINAQIVPSGVLVPHGASVWPSHTPNRIRERSARLSTAQERHSEDPQTWPYCRIRPYMRIKAAPAAPLDLGFLRFSRAGLTVEVSGNMKRIIA